MANYKEEYIKCYTDKTRIYFITNYLTTFNADQRITTPFNLFPRQKAFLHSLVENNNTIAIKHRQAGITTVSAAWATGQCVFTNQNAPETILCIGNKLDISQQLLEKMTYFLDQVPRWMWGSEYYSPDKDSAKNTKSIYKTRNKDKIELFNGCKIYARSSGPNAARGISAVSILIFDEAAFIESGPDTYSQAVAATSSVKDSKIIMVSTPNGKDQLYYKTYKQAQDGKNNYNTVEFKWFQDLRYNRNLKWYKDNEETGERKIQIEPIIGNKGEIPYDEEKWRKLEKDGWKPTSPWYEEMCKSFNNDTQRIAQELDVSFLGSSDTVVPPEIIDFHRNVNVIELTEKWELKDVLIKDTWIWEDPIPGHRYILGVDPSGGSSEDSTAIEVLDADGVNEQGIPVVKQVLEYNGKMTGDEIGEMVYKYGTAYNNALVVVEGIGGYGDACILTLIAKRYPNLYYDESSLKTYTMKRNYSQFTDTDEGKLPGFRTNTVRLQMIGNFVAALKENSILIRSIRVINELDTWIWKNGRPDHMAGFHDDLLTCLSMTMFVMQFYMIQKERDKKLSSAILHSWRVNNAGEQAIADSTMKLQVDISDKYSMPYFTSSTRYKTKASKLNAMLMLTGFIKHNQ